MLIALGSNVEGAWGDPLSSLRRAVSSITGKDVALIAVSRLYMTPAVGLVRQPSFLNAVILVKSGLTPRSLMIAAKRLERAAGRRSGVQWGPRPLDIDLIAHESRLGRQLPLQPRSPSRLTALPGKSTDRPKTMAPSRPPGHSAHRLPVMLPHPELHRRAFVLVPLRDVAPDWRHPVSGQTVSQMLRLTGRQSMGIRPILDSNWYMCDKPR
ncbi:MAG TPA: 2-amino-4-hydroxy-6-hydroxymethyldihydropteridine diphosphokinase [Hyphomicrobiaceae bacterium]|nr:2-amino-4-hydroxy-6-hydroxymethyldihydropteridine diphosphokinase [Hyphomicrobiaceae bacterium]